MIATFKQKNPSNAFILLLYGLVIKFPMFLNPSAPQLNSGDNILYNGVLNFMEPLTERASIVYALIAFLLLFVQATLLNRIVNSLKLFPQQNYLTGMAYLLITSMMLDWSGLSAPLIVNLLLIWIWYQLIRLQNANNPKAAIFNVAMLVGVLPLIYAPAIVYILLLLLALIVIRPFRLTEIFVALLGVLAPYYFFFVLLFLTDQWGIEKVVPQFDFFMPKLPTSLWLSGGLVLLLLPFVLGGYYVQDNLNKMLIQVRKSWSILLLILLVSLTIILTNPDGSYASWMVTVVPLAVFHAATYFYFTVRWPAVLLHWISFTFVILLNYGIF